MAETSLTVIQIVDLGLWEKVCDYKGWDYWIVRDGKIEVDEIVTFDSELKKDNVDEILEFEIEGVVESQFYHQYECDELMATIYTDNDTSLNDELLKFVGKKVKIKLEVI